MSDRQPAVHADNATESIADRVLRQVRTETLDQDRAVNDKERLRDTLRTLDNLSRGENAYRFVARQGETMRSAEAAERRSAERRLVDQVIRWRREIAAFAENRLGEFDELIRAAIESPAPVEAAE